MRNISTLALFSVILTNAPRLEASEWKVTKETKLNSVNIPINEKIFNYDRNNLKTIQIDEYNSETVILDYDAAGNVVREDSRKYNEYEQLWYINSRTEYSYNENNQIAAYKKYYSNFDYSITMNAYVEYEYNEQGYLIREKTYQNDNKELVLLLVEYLNFNEAGKPFRKNVYDSEENITLTGYSEYLYDINSNVTQETVYSKNIGSGNMELSNKYSWIYDESGNLEQYQSYRWNPIENILINENRLEYSYDAATNNLTSTVSSYWNHDNSVWNKTHSFKYAYSKEIDGTKAPVNLKAQLTDNTYVLSWEAPEDQNGLTGYNIYNGFMLIDNVSASTLNYTVTATAVGLSPVYITAVYGTKEGNISDYVELEELEDNESIQYPMPTLGGISYINQYGMGNMDIEVYWNAPETDKEISGYNLYFNFWQQNESPITETVNRFTIMRAVSSATIGVSTVYKDGVESVQDEKLFDLEELLAGITNASVGKDIWSYANTICINGDQIRSIEIFDATGMKIVSQIAKDGINIIKLPANIYIVRAITNQGTVSKKLTVK